ncbi:MAG: alpha/beta fold hydrolase [Dactylosporangium sp.]|nr:alpha/beta hydrolase [Dactylosporangium sp.]NNJ62923.1 alpha/beta fold hydrolase [Dactylosporangium sp.]
MTTRGVQRTRVVRPIECTQPPASVRREVLAARPEVENPASPPVLLVPGFGYGAWAYAEHWLDHIAERGFAAHAMSLRGHGRSDAAPDADLRAYVHDVIQIAAGLPRQAVLVGHGAGALVVAMALSRYPARAGVLVSPVFGGFGTALSLLRRNPVGAFPGLFGGTVRLGPRQLFSRALSTASAREYADRLAGPSRRAQRALVRRQEPERPVGDPPVLVLGSPDDRMVARTALEQVAERYGIAPLLFPGMGHDLVLDARWREPADAICDWLLKLP